MNLKSSGKIIITLGGPKEEVEDAYKKLEQCPKCKAPRSGIQENIMFFSCGHYFIVRFKNSKGEK